MTNNGENKGVSRTDKKRGKEMTEEMSTIEAHRKMAHRQARRLEITKGIPRGERIRRVNQMLTKGEMK